MFANLIVLVTAVSTAFAWDVPTSFVLVGDSTTANDTVPNSGGWGNGFCASLVSNTPCINTAHDGATTGSFIASGLFNTSLAFITGEVQKGRRTIVTVQFGHNDMKIAPPESMGQNLTIMVSQIRTAGGEPVLVTPLTRRTFDASGKIDDSLGPWANQTRLIAEQERTHVLDLNAASIVYVEAIGPDAAHRLNRLPDDNTHLNTNGTIVFGRMVADLMKISFEPGFLPIIRNPPLTFNITHGIASF